MKKPKLAIPKCPYCHKGRMETTQTRGRAGTEFVVVRDRRCGRCKKRIYTVELERQKRVGVYRVTAEVTRAIAQLQKASDVLTRLVKDK